MSKWLIENECLSCLAACLVDDERRKDKGLIKTRSNSLRSLVFRKGTERHAVTK